MVAVGLGTGEHPRERREEIVELDPRQRALDADVGRRGPDLEDIAADAGQFVELLRRLLVPLVFPQPAHELGPRILLVIDALGPRQQQARLDLRQHRRHREVLGRELEPELLHQVDVFHVLPRDRGDGDIDDVEVLALDQVEKQVERPFERLEKDLQRIGRNVEIPRQLDDRLAIHHRERHLLLPGSTGRLVRDRVRRPRVDSVHVPSYARARGASVVLIGTRAPSPVVRLPSFRARSPSPGRSRPR